MREPTDSTRKPGLDEEADGLECFATESVSVVDEAHDLTAFACEEVLPAVRVTAAPPESMRHPVRQAVVVSTPEVLPAPITQPSVWRRSWPGLRVTVVALVFLVVGVIGMWINVNRVRQEPTVVVAPVTSPTAAVPNPASAAPNPISVPATPPAPALARPLATAAAPARPAVSTSTPQPLRPPTVPASELPIASAPAEAVPVEPAPTIAIERSVAAEPEIVRAEPAAEAESVRAPVVTPPTDRASIERVLEQYRDAYDRLDAPSAAVIWPRVDTRALSRAFSTLTSQDLSFEHCDLDITGVKANAQCTGEIRYVRRVGDQVPRVRRMSWSFALERVSDRWQIAQVTAD